MLANTGGGAEEITSARIKQLFGAENFRQFAQILTNAENMLNSGVSAQATARALKNEEGLIGSAFAMLLEQGDTTTFKSFAEAVRGLSRLAEAADDSYTRGELEQIREQLTRLIDFQSGAWQEQAEPSRVTGSLKSVESLIRRYANLVTSKAETLKDPESPESSELRAVRGLLVSIGSSKDFLETIQQISALADTLPAARNYDDVVKALRPLEGIFGGKIMSLVKRGNIGELNRIAAELKGIGESLTKFADEEVMLEDVLALGRNARDLAKFLTPDPIRRTLDRPPQAAASEVQDAFEQFRVAFSQETAEAILRHVLENLEEALEAQGRPDPFKAKNLLFTL